VFHEHLLFTLLIHFDNFEFNLINTKIYKIFII